MALILNDEQQMLKTSAKELLKEQGSIAVLRKLRDENDATGFDTDLWKLMADMGWAALTIPEEYGGLNFGYTGLGQLLEETGRTLTASPLISTVLLSSTALSLGGSILQKETLLPEIALGKLIIAFASDESAHHKPGLQQTTAKFEGKTICINGTKRMVLDGHIAQKFIVSASLDNSDDIGLFIIDSTADGVDVQTTKLMDSRFASTVRFKTVKIDRSAQLDAPITGLALLEKIIDIGRIGLAAEMLGGIQEAFERTIAYLKEREQFGVKIGSFQALQHRAALMFCEIELCKSIVLKALKAIDNNDDDLARLASLAKAKLGQTYKLVSNEGIQMFGGIGMTDDEEIGFFLKRARVAQQILGDTSFHLDRLAKMKGY